MKRIALIAKARSGSHLLKSLMPADRVFATDEPFWNGFFQHGYFSFWKEKIDENPEMLLHGREKKLYEEYLSLYFERTAAKHLMFDMKIEQLNTFAGLKIVIRNQFDGFVLLRRQNLLKMAVSQLVMAERTKQDIAANSGEVPPLQRVEVVPNQIANRIEASEQQFNEFDAFFAGSKKPCFRVTYEDLSADPIATATELLDYFDIGGTPPEQSHLSKQNPYPISDIVINYEELARVLENRGLQQYLDLPI